ncbi:MAG TPA: transposase [Phycisphaerae bacterium]|nr:transposase [Phycisphaerae bacterium]
MERQDRRKIEDLRTHGRSRAVRWDRYNYRDDAVIHITNCADRGAPFSDAGVAKMTADSVIRCCELRMYRLFGFCLMPDHLHTLLSPGDSGCPLAQWLDAFKSFTGHEFVKLGGVPPLWQRSCYDHVCRDGETAENVMRYIVNNPVRKGLVEDWRDWPWTRVFIEI